MPTPPPDDGDNADTPGTVVRYPGFGACPVCGYAVEEFAHWTNGFNKHVVAVHNGRECVLPGTWYREDTRA